MPEAFLLPGCQVGQPLDAGARGDDSEAAGGRQGDVSKGALAEQDPVVKAGQLRVEAMTWWFGKGYMTFPKAGEKAPERKPSP
jgi:hypothetical protein